MAFHSTKSIVGVLVICTLQSVFFACVSASRTPHDQSPSISPESTRISEVGKLPVTDAWYSAQIVNENDVFLATPKGLWRSFNGGRTWEEVYESREYGGTITKTYFLNSSIGWMETHSGWFKSEDGGHTWESFGNPLSSSGRLRDIKFINRETGWIAGATLRAPSEKELGPGGAPNIPRYLYDDVTRKVFVPTVYRTDDGGKTWRAQTLPSGLGSIERISFIDSNYGIALGNHEVMLTRDGGIRWTGVKDPRTCRSKDEEEPYEGRPVSVSILDSSFAWIAFDDGRMHRTTNGGLTWIELQPCQQNRPLVAHFSSQDHGIGLANDRFLYETIDGGKQWIKIGTDKYGSLAFKDREYVWLVSENALFRIDLDTTP